MPNLPLVTPTAPAVGPRRTHPPRLPEGEAWRPESGPPLLTCAVLTTAANEVMRPIHDRMPVILDPRHYDLWIDRNVQEPVQQAEALRPVPADAMRAYPVSPWVNDARHDDARCLELA